MYKNKIIIILNFLLLQGLERHLLGSHGLVTSSMQEAANRGKDAGRCPACGRVSFIFIVEYTKLYAYQIGKYELRQHDT